MKRKLLFDSSVYIKAMRDRRPDLLAVRRLDVETIYFSTVVGSELLRGATERKVVDLVEELWRDFKRMGRLVLPGVSDWHDAGIVLAKIAAKYGYERVGQSRLVHDALIALSARRLGVGIVTFNVADFERIAEFRPVRVLSARDVETS
jgi:predicted nucleic acid-binding protein